MPALDLRQGVWLQRALGFPGRLLGFGLAVVLLIHVPVVYALLSLAVIGWGLPAYLVMLEQLDASEEARRCADRHASAVSAQVRTARMEIDRLNGDLAAALASTDTHRTDDDPLYRRVGLHPQCPAFVLAAARRAYRVALHPDRHPEHCKAEAHERFVAVEATFTEIDRQRVRA